MYSSIFTRTVVVTSFLAISLSQLSFAGGPKLSADLSTVHPSDDVDVIVEFREDAYNRVAADRAGKFRITNSALKVSLPGLRSEVVTTSGRNLASLADDPDVVAVRPDRKLRSTSFNGTLDYGWITAGAKAAGETFGFDGAGIGIAVLDSGIDEHPDLNSTGKRVRYAANFLKNEQNAGDDYGHGTHVAGIIAGNGLSSQVGGEMVQVRGIAPGAHLVSFRVLDRNGEGTDSAVIRAIDKAIELKSVYNIRVLNLSIGRPVYESHLTDPLCRAVEKAWQAGIVVVAAAGNEGRNDQFGTQGYGTITAPGNSPKVITVGAMNTVGSANRSDDKIATYSSKGPTAVDHIVKPDLVAPGNAVISLLVSRFHALGHVPRQRCSGLDISKLWSKVRLFPNERYEHGGSGRQRSSRTAPAAESEIDSGPRQVPLDEECVQTTARGHAIDRPDHRRYLSEQSRRIYGGRGISGHHGCAEGRVDSGRRV